MKWPGSKELKSDAVETASDERTDERVSAHRAADLNLGGGKTPVACLLRDISESGVKLHYDSPHNLPKHVHLILSHPHEEHICEVAWQRDKEIGLRFVEE